MGVVSYNELKTMVFECYNLEKLLPPVSFTPLLIKKGGGTGPYDTLATITRQVLIPFRLSNTAGFEKDKSE